MTLQYQENLPKDRWDRCKFCGNIRKQPTGNRRGQTPVCSKQGCPGQHTAAGISLTKEELDALK